MFTTSTYDDTSRIIPEYTDPSTLEKLDLVYRVRNPGGGIKTRPGEQHNEALERKSARETSTTHVSDSQQSWVYFYPT